MERAIGEPTVRRIGSARFFFYSNDAAEPAHIHVEQTGSVAKFRLERLVARHRQEFLEAWHDFFLPWLGA